MGRRIGINRMGGIYQNPTKRVVCDLVFSSPSQCDKRQWGGDEIAFFSQFATIKYL